MKFLLREDLGESAIREIGNHLRAHGTGRYWIERYRGDTFINAADTRDVRILENEFRQYLTRTK